MEICLYNKLFIFLLGFLIFFFFSFRGSFLVLFGSFRVLPLDFKRIYFNKNVLVLLFCFQLIFAFAYGID